MEDEWTLEAITPQKNMARFSKKMLNIFEKYDKPFENSVLVNIETMAYDTPNGPEPWRGEITYPVLDADAGSDQSDMSIDSPQSGAMDAAACTGQADMSIAAPQTGAMEMKTPTAVNINEQTYVGTNEQDDPEEQEVHATSTSLKTDAIESTVLPASAKKNETFILSSDKRPRDLKLIISPMTDKRISVALRSMSYLKIDQTYSVNLDCLIEDAFLPKSYETVPCQTV
ncbi:Holliday junction recognition protein isoform X3 [Lissotriton helveticus]